MADHHPRQVFVTGGSGYVGRNLIRRLRRERCRCLGAFFGLVLRI